MDFEEPSKDGYSIYTKSGCTFCTKAKNLLKNESVNMIDCDEYLLEDKEGFLKFIENKVGKEYRTFPMVFLKGQFIGGFKETQLHYDKLMAFT